MLLPLPDSPTSASVRPAETEKLTLLTALPIPRLAKMWVSRFRTSRITSFATAAGAIAGELSLFVMDVLVTLAVSRSRIRISDLPKLRVEAIAQPVAEEVDSEDGQCQRQAGKDGD